MSEKKKHLNNKNFSLIRKWFFPPTFSILFYPAYIFIWFWLIDEWDRNLSNFFNYSLTMLSMYSIFYLSMDSKDGRFTKFLNFIETREKWKARSIAGITIILWFILILITMAYFPIKEI
tara:strand:- start:83 stop:439 length:357 start_codon:yes stop_codon:yes gene_type:complete